MRKIKWILFAILITMLIVTVFLFINFINNDEIINVDVSNKLLEIYQEKLYRDSYSIYENGEIVMDIKSLDNSDYIVFKEKVIEYCDSEEVCNNTSCVYDDENENIILDKDIDFLRKGIYKIEILDDSVQLLLEDNNKKMVYYFNRPKG